MAIRRIVPDIHSNAIEQSKQFYSDFLGLDLTMDMGWVLTFVSPSNPTAQITLIQTTDSQPPPPNITIEVDDVDAVYSRATSRGLRIVYPLTEEPWGVRRFFVVDPNGITINIMSHKKDV